MKLIVGLGNPGEKYRNNRHNVGYLFLDYIIQKKEVSSINYQVSSVKPFKRDKYSEAEITEIKLNNETIILAKPQTFMNESGRAVKKIVSSMKYKVLIMNDMFVVHDDLDIKLGEYKIQLGKGPKLHNGIESIEKALGTTEFWRIRIGVDNRDSENRMPGEKYVLQDFTLEEKKTLQSNFDEILTTFVRKHPSRS